MMRFCGNPEPHERHEWLDGVRREDCPGVKPSLPSDPASSDVEKEEDGQAARDDPGF